MEPIETYWDILAGGMVLGILHAVIPNHWMPFAILARGRQWGSGRLAWITALGGGAHVISTIILGVLVGYASMEFEGWSEILHKLGPILLCIIGAVLIVLHVMGRGHHHHQYEHALEDDSCECPEESPGTIHYGHASEQTVREAVARGTVVPIVIAMFFSPCLELEVYYVQAASRGWFGIGILSLLYFVVTVTGMVVASVLFHRGLQKLNLAWIERNEFLVNGLILILLGIAVMMIEPAMHGAVDPHHHHGH